VPETLPLFPLGTVLLPGRVLPLHVFEERYRTLVRDLLTLPPSAPRRFGVVAIRSGWEVGAGGVRALHDVGCTAEVRRVEELDDGRFALVTVGSRRFALRQVDDGAAPYLVGEVDLLPEAVGDGRATALVADVRALFPAYRSALATARNLPHRHVELPDDPVELSYVVAAGTVVDPADVQQLLAAPDAVARLAAERSLLEREVRLLRLLPALPAPELGRVPQGLN
jgi:Lon protease-like protein